MTYSIVRYYFTPKIGQPRIIKRGLTLEGAQEHCNNLETSSSTCTSPNSRACTSLNGEWFDGYEQEETRK